MKKAAQMAGAVVAQKMGQLPPQQMPLVAQVIKLKALDEIEEEKGVRDVDIIIAVNKHELDTTPEIQAIMQKAQQSVQQHAV